MVEFDKNGNPLISIAKGKVIGFLSEETKQILTPNKEVDAVSVGNYKAVPWYDDNDFPNAADLLISNTPVLKRALNDLTRVTLGQGVFPCEVTDTLPNGMEILTMIKDPIITAQLNNYTTRRYLVKTQYDVNSYGSGFVEFIPNLEGTKIVNLNHVNAMHCRLEAPDNNGMINNVLVSGLWPDATAAELKPYILLDEIDPMAHLLQLKETGKLKGNSVFMHIKNSFSSNDFYPVPNWYTAKKWISISQKVPKIIEAGMDNVLNIFFMVRIPIGYWDWKYPAQDFQSEKERRDKIQADIEKLQTEFTTVETTRKALITHFGFEEAGNDKWDIEIIQPKFNQENFVTSSASDTQIAIAAGYSADLLGLMYGNSKGGSMQRELLLLQYALSWESRQQLADPIEMMLKFNNPGMTNLVLRFRNTFLTTLDTGAGTGTQLS
jgi:hypothetical protein